MRYLDCFNEGLIITVFVNKVKQMGAGTVFTIDVAAFWEDMEPGYGDTLSGWRIYFSQWFPSLLLLNPLRKLPTASSIQDRIMFAGNFIRAKG